jgi:hypothetical protein
MRLRRKALSCALSRRRLGSGMIACSILSRCPPPFSTGFSKKRIISQILEKGKKLALFLFASLPRSSRTGRRGRELIQELIAAGCPRATRFSPSPDATGCTHHASRPAHSFPSLLGKVARRAGWGMARYFEAGGLRDHESEPSTTHSCFPHPIRRASPDTFPTSWRRGACTLKPRRSRTVSSGCLKPPPGSPTTLPSFWPSPAGRHDDQVDSTAQALAWAKQRPAGAGMLDYWRRLAEEG